jgi:murein DD-endopeptidase MepM/ murein hydrolase activator NlpD
MKFSGMLGRTLGISLLAISGVVVSFATMAPGKEAVQLPPRLAVVEPLAIDADHALVPPPSSYIREEQFQRGDTVSAFLARLGVAETQLQRLSRVRALQQLRPGWHVRAEVNTDGTPLALSFLTGRDTLVQITADGEGYRVTDERAALYTQIAMKASVVRSSLFAATDDAGIPDSIAMQVADIFGGDIDFHRDLRKGDRFSVVYELHHLAGRPVRAGRVLAAEFTNHAKTYRAVHFGSGYYTPDGNNLRKAFLRSPLEFSRVSSGFGMRLHPLFRTKLVHRGIDYAAPTGTRVRAIGDGVVEYAGPKGGYGNVVILRHQGQYSTLYAHLSRFAGGLRRGARVAQNDTIGFVGQTGWATGPHLHYEFLVAGQQRNPLSLAMPAALPVAPQELRAFHERAAPLAVRLDLLANSSLALLE